MGPCGWDNIRYTGSSKNSAYLGENKAVNEKKFKELKDLIYKVGEKKALELWDGIYYVQSCNLYALRKIYPSLLHRLKTPGGRNFTSLRTERK